MIKTDRFLWLLLLQILAIPSCATKGDIITKAENKAPGSSSHSTWREKKTGIEFVQIPGGEFEMGINNGWSDDQQPAHLVRVSNFMLARTEVTQAQWRAVMGSDPSTFSGCADCPVEQVQWVEAQMFIQKVSAQTGLPLRMPTEAEWEYAAGGGAAHQTWAGTSSESDLWEYAWYNANAGGKTHPVCQKRPNSYGLCDMSGNVWEWVADWYGLYSSGFANNPSGPSSGLGSMRVIRGGSWYAGQREVRVAFRGADQPGDRSGALGLRLALSQQDGSFPHSKP